MNNIVVGFERESFLIDKFRKNRLRKIFDELAGSINPFKDKPRTLKEAQDLSDEEEFLEKIRQKEPENNPVLDQLLKMLLE